MMRKADLLRVKTGILCCFSVAGFIVLLLFDADRRSNVKRSIAGDGNWTAPGWVGQIDDSRPSLGGGIFGGAFSRKLFQNVKTHDDNQPERHLSKVILFTYMRSGSTLLGELFNQNSDAFYMFEPVAGFHPALLGMPIVGGYQPLDIHFNWNGTRRYPTKLEMDSLTELVQNILGCDVQRWPTEVLVSPFTRWFGQSGLQTSFIPCSDQAAGNADPQSSYQAGAFWKEKVNRCKNMATSCPLFPNTENMTLCADRLNPAATQTFFSGYSSYQTLTEFDQHNKCISAIRDSIKGCLPNLQKDCNSRTINVFKTIRMDMGTIGNIVSKDSTVKVIFHVRDPRAILASRPRLSLLSRISYKDIKREGKYFCEKMASDLAVYEHIRSMLPNNVMLTRHEDLIAQPNGILQRMYEFIDQQVPPSVQSWLHENLNATSDGGVYGTKRKDPVNGNSKWRTSLTPDVQEYLTVQCRDVLEKLGYDL